jgi:predicted flavoprotein YhiN
MSRSQRTALAGELLRMELHVEGKSTNKDEFVTCGGVQLSEVDPKSMESRIVAGLYFAGEVLDVDAITGGFNFQSAWTTGWLVGTNLSVG